MGYAVEVDARGVLFDGTLEREIEAGLHDALGDVADDAKNNILQVFGSVLRTHPTMRLEEGVGVREVGADFIVDDGGVIYGPWIEGVGSRNRSTRFKGYATYRRVAQSVQRRATAIAERAIRRRMSD